MGLLRHYISRNDRKELPWDCRATLAVTKKMCHSGLGPESRHYTLFPNHHK